MEFTIGDRVSHRETGELGVVIGHNGPDVEVAFGSSTQIMAADDLAATTADDLGALCAGDLGRPAPAQLRLLARLVRHSYQFDPGAGLSNARLEPQLHQAFVAHRVVARKLVPRMILADEVGLGKTIEAGLIIKELRARNLADRILIVTPASLKRQWQVELQSKFNEQFDVMDGDAAKHFGRRGANPFLAKDSIICSLPFAAAKKRQEQILAAPWDLVVFDEAHRVRRTRSSATQAYRLAEELRDQTPGLLLLSATPVQLHASELYSLIDLVEPGLFSGLQAYERERKKIPRLNEAMRLVSEWPAKSMQQRSEAWGDHGALLTGLGVSRPDDLLDADTRDQVMDRIIEVHPTADLMVRNRKAELGIGAKRRAMTVRVPQSDAEREVYLLATDYIRQTAILNGGSNTMGFLLVNYQRMLTSSSHSLRTSLQRRLAKLQQHLGGLQRIKVAGALAEDDMDSEEVSSSIEEIEGAVAQATAEALLAEISLLEGLIDLLYDIRDSKAAKLVDILKTLSDGEMLKIVVFTQFIETQMFIQRTLQANGYSVTVFNGRMGSDEKEDAIREFREATDILVSTEAGGEGRNLQFSHVIINYDLPWNPMKVEQRIGRLDRIGQTHVVEIFNLVYEDTLEERIVDVLQERIRIFEESVGNLDPILGSLEEELNRIALNTPLADLDHEFASLSEQVHRDVEAARLLEQTMADFVLDRASFRSDKARQLLDEPSLATSKDLETVVSRGLEFLGGTLSSHDLGGEQISLSPRLASRLAGGTQVHHGVFDPAEALRMDELPFFACGHPLIDSILEDLSGLTDHVGARISSEAPPGISVEIIWRLRATLVVPEAKLVRHIVTPDLRVLDVDLHELPLSDHPVDITVDEAFARSAVQASRDVFQTTFAKYREEMLLKIDDLRHQRLRRAERVFRSREERIQARIDDEQAFISNAEGNPTPQNQRILPARRGRLAKDRDRLHKLREDFEEETASLLHKRPDIRAEVFAVNLLLGHA